MTPEDLDKLLKLIALGQAAFAEAINLINNHFSQGGKTDSELLDRSQQHTQEALDIINKL